ncbi:hypothetical protein E3P86_03517 [Wallemia ichthyophaga]|uniref:Peptidyl-prolyl cis-trans isomerase n=1 Tax=Wallemia ichthyophaga TaxID=245174 RepID=A0A4T0IKI4_WALIC|nr:hypothetical protein E3P86_03517 [Wallemia ichthyophaga]
MRNESCLNYFIQYRHLNVCNLAHFSRRSQKVFCEAVPQASEPCALVDIMMVASFIGFMTQTGDPTGSGKGGQSIYGEPYPDEIRSTFKFNNRGLVAFANSGSDSNRSQFFITYAATPHLNSKYTIFGRVIDGAENGTLDAIERVPSGTQKEGFRPKHDILLKYITIHSNPIASKIVRDNYV